MRNASNNEVKLLRKLNRKKYREKEQRFIVEGDRAVEQVVENGLVEVETVFVVEGKTVSDQLSPLSVLIKAEILEEVADTDNPQGVLALCKMREEPQPEILAGTSGIIVATDAIQDPGNMGTILRTAVWFGAKALITGKGSVDVYHPKVVRSTAGATGSIPVLNGELEEFLIKLEGSGWEVLLLDGGADSVELGSVHPAERTVLVVGNEGNGIAESLLSSGRKKVRIESGAGAIGVESLNAAIAVGIALWELKSEK